MWIVRIKTVFTTAYAGHQVKKGHNLRKTLMEDFSIVIGAHALNAV